MKQLLKRNMLLVIIVIFIMNMLGCSNEENEDKQEKSPLNIFLDIDDEYSNEVMNFLIKEYQNSNEDVDVKLNVGLKNNNVEFEERVLLEDSDIIITNRNKMIELYKKGLISDITNLYNENKYNESMYNIINSYGRIRENYYGIGIIPYSIELLYNKNALKELNINPPKNPEEWLYVLKNIKESGIKTPIVINEGIEIQDVIAAMVINNTVNMENLMEKYDSGKSQYIEIGEMQKAFDNINEFYNTGYLDNNTFTVGNEGSIDKFIRGDIPLLISTSYFHSKFNHNDIGIIEDYYSLDHTSKYNIPIIVNSLLCVSINNKNKIETEKLIKFIFGDDIQTKLVQMGYITGNKKSNKEFTSINEIIVKHIFDTGDNSVLFIYNMPYKLVKDISYKVEEILNGNYTGEEWKSIIENNY